MVTRTKTVACDELDSEFVRIFEMHVEAIRAYCLRRLPVDEANDAVSEVFLVAWRRRTEMPTGAELRPWLFGVARNVVRTSRRTDQRVVRLRARLAHQKPTIGSDTDVGIGEGHANSDVARALAELRDDDREILRLRAWEGLTTQQIATALDISLAAAEKRLSRALSRLRPLLDSKGEI